MKKTLKTAMFAFAVVAAGFGGIKTYQSYTVNESTLMSANVEALSQDNSGDGANSGNYRYPDKSGKCRKCTLDKCFSLQTGIAYNDSNECIAAEGHVSFEFHQVPGIYDLCDQPNGSGCNPYSCQQVAY